MAKRLAITRKSDYFEIFSRELVKPWIIKKQLPGLGAGQPHLEILMPRVIFHRSLRFNGLCNFSASSQPGSGHLEAAALAQKRNELLDPFRRDPVRSDAVPEFF